MAEGVSDASSKSEILKSLDEWAIAESKQNAFENLLTEKARLLRVAKEPNEREFLDTLINFGPVPSTAVKSFDPVNKETMMLKAEITKNGKLKITKKEEHWLQITTTVGLDENSKMYPEKVEAYNLNSDEIIPDDTDTVGRVSKYYLGRKSIRELKEVDPPKPVTP